ncbi:MAG: hypothetical protein HY609_04590 [Deltaproteobacteria bacterium]|nr:hypothetical protein [Deltaproteobacteria bacterium]MBI4224188.1 hypothetical protein [Deltaproteobacteria bacterium]
MVFGTDKKENQKGFASFEFAWAAFFLTLLIIVFFRFFDMLNKTTRALIVARHRAFETVGRPAGGAVRQGEIPSSVPLDCEDGRCRFSASPVSPFFPEGGEQNVFLVLNP